MSGFCWPAGLQSRPGKPGRREHSRPNAQHPAITTFSACGNVVGDFNIAGGGGLGGPKHRGRRPAIRSGFNIGEIEVSEYSMSVPEAWGNYNIGSETSGSIGFLETSATPASASGTQATPAKALCAATTTIGFNQHPATLTSASNVRRLASSRASILLAAGTRAPARQPVQISNNNVGIFNARTETSGM